MVARPGGADQDLAVTQFPRNCVTKMFILFWGFLLVFKRNGSQNQSRTHIGNPRLDLNSVHSEMSSSLRRKSLYGLRPALPVQNQNRHISN